MPHLKFWPSSVTGHGMARHGSLWTSRPGQPVPDLEVDQTSPVAGRQLHGLLIMPALSSITDHSRQPRQENKSVSLRVLFLNCCSGSQAGWLHANSPFFAVQCGDCWVMMELMLISMIIYGWFQCNLFFSRTENLNREGSRASSNRSGSVAEEFAVGLVKLIVFFGLVV